MSHPMVRSWAFNWAAEGRSPRTMEEMQWFMHRFDVQQEAAGGSLLTSTRSDCEQFIAAFPTPSRRNYAWRSLRSFYGFVSGEQETPNPMSKVKAPKIPLISDHGQRGRRQQDVAGLLSMAHRYGCPQRRHRLDVVGHRSASIGVGRPQRLGP